jgi:hypothetical protein
VGESPEGFGDVAGGCEVRDWWGVGEPEVFGEVECWGMVLAWKQGEKRVEMYLLR